MKVLQNIADAPKEEHFAAIIPGHSGPASMNYIIFEGEDDMKIWIRANSLRPFCLIQAFPKTITHDIKIT